MICLIGGTTESRAIAQRLTRESIPWLATVVTPRARALYQDLPGQIRVGALTPPELTSFLQKADIRAIVDASHPFATEISRQAIATGLPYLRFERPDLPVEPPAQQVPDLGTVLQPRYLDQRRVLLTLGVKSLAAFRPWQTRAQLWARILPTPEAQSRAIAAGFAPERLIPTRLPVSHTQERDLWRTLAVDTVITKASGQAGGVAIKQAVARELQTPLLIIARPSLNYPEQTADLNRVCSFCRHWLEDDIL